MLLFFDFTILSTAAFLINPQTVTDPVEMSRRNFSPKWISFHYHFKLLIAFLARRQAYKVESYLKDGRLLL